MASPYTRQKLLSRIVALEAALEEGVVAQQMRFGIKVEKNAVNLPASTSLALFTVSDGRVALIALQAKVTTVIQSQACAAKFRFDPTIGLVGDLSATADLNAAAVGTNLSLLGGPATTAAVLSTAFSAALANPIILDEGQILLNTAATNTGQMEYSAWYIPLDDGAVLSVA
jgi:hypothetical protein